MRFQKKPVVIEAWQNPFPSKRDGWVEIPKWVMDGGAIPLPGGKFTIKTLEGEMIADPGDWIIKGVKGELYPCKPDIFEETYEAVE